MAWQQNQRLTGQLAGVEITVDLPTYARLTGIEFPRSDWLVVTFSIWGSKEAYEQGAAPAKVITLEFTDEEQLGEPAILDPLTQFSIHPAGPVIPSAVQLLANPELAAALDTVKRKMYELSPVFVRDWSTAKKV